MFYHIKSQNYLTITHLYVLDEYNVYYCCYLHILQNTTQEKMQMVIYNLI